MSLYVQLVDYWQTRVEQEGRRAAVFQLLLTLCFASLFLVSGHYHTNNPGGYGLFLPFNTVSWIPIFLIVGLGTWKVAAGHRLQYSELSKLLFLSCALLSIPLFYLNASIGQSALRMIGLWMGLLLFLSLQQFHFSIRQLHLLLVLMLLGVLIEAGRYWWVMLESYISVGMFPINYKYGMYGVFQQTNVFASFAATGLVIAAYLLAQYREHGYGKLFLVLPLLAPLLLFQVLVACVSRTGWWGVAVGSVLILPYLYRAVPRRLFALWLLSWLAGYGIFLLMVYIGDFSIPSKDILSLEGPRSYTFPQTVDMILTKPWFGFGFGTFEFNYMHFVAEQYANGQTAMPPYPESTHPHNEFLFWGVEGGIVPIMGLLLAAWSVWRAVNKLELLQRLAVIGLFFPLVLHTQVEFPFYASVLHWVAFILFIHHVDALTSEPEGRSLMAGKSLRVIAITVPALAILFLVTTLQAGMVYWQFVDRNTPLTSFASIPNAVVWRNHLNWGMYSSGLLIGRDNDRPELIQQYIDWVPQMVAQQPRPLFYEYLVMAHLLLNQKEEANAVIEEFRFLFPGRDFSVITVN